MHDTHQIMDDGRHVNMEGMTRWQQRRGERGWRACRISIARARSRCDAGKRHGRAGCALVRKTRYQALKLMLKIHRDGSGECGVYTVEQASNIAAHVAELASGNGYPLRCSTEPHSRA